MPEAPRMKAEAAAGPTMKRPRSFCRWMSRERRTAPDEEDRRDEHVRRVDPARDVRGEPTRWLQGRRKRPCEVGDDREEGAEDDCQGPRSHRFATDSPHSYRGIGYTSSPPSHF